MDPGELEARYRSANEAAIAATERFLGALPEHVHIMCECPSDDCEPMIDVPTRLYLAVRDHGSQFVVAPDHVLEREERAVVMEDGCWVVERLLDEGDFNALADEDGDGDAETDPDVEGVA